MGFKNVPFFCEEDTILQPLLTVSRRHVGEKLTRRGHLTSAMQMRLSLESTVWDFERRPRDKELTHISGGTPERRPTDPCH